MEKGQVFQTRFEVGCVVTVPEAEYGFAGMPGEFLALDSDGVECVFNVDMVVV